MEEKKDIDIIKNVKIVEWLKSELLTAVASLFAILTKGVQNTKEDILDIISNIILVTYLLGKRLGLSYGSINLKIQNKIKLGLLEENKLEKWFGDLSDLQEFFNGNKE